MKIKKSIEINAGAEIIWPFLVEPTNIMKWCGPVKRILYTSEQHTGLKTIPQIYVGAKHVGGASETFDAVRNGSMQKMLEENNVSWNQSVDTDPYSFLPGWLHKR